jgi:hypothetical protein
MQAQLVGIAGLALLGFFAAWLATAPLAVVFRLLGRMIQPMPSASAIPEPTATPAPAIAAAPATTPVSVAVEHAVTAVADETPGEANSTASTGFEVLGAHGAEAAA